ncbi:MAG: group III truncated hemoglobin [Rhodobacteraceae bacterium]|nr:group III truncated hemoglobin [Paracoccaceae bacterium]
MIEQQRRVDARAEVRAQIGIDESMIDRLVREFYRRVKEDPLLGPVFSARISDWEPHLQKMHEFWSSVVLMTGRYHGQPMEKHMLLPVDARHFDRWIMLFTKTSRSICPPVAAQHFNERARRIAQSLELNIAGQQGVTLKKGERFRRSDRAVLLPGNATRETESIS